MRPNHAYLWGLRQKNAGLLHDRTTRGHYVACLGPWTRGWHLWERNRGLPPAVHRGGRGVHRWRSPDHPDPSGLCGLVCHLRLLWWLTTATECQCNWFTRNVSRGEYHHCLGKMLRTVHVFWENCIASPNLAAATGRLHVFKKRALSRRKGWTAVRTLRFRLDAGSSIDLSQLNLKWKISLSQKTSTHTSDATRSQLGQLQPAGEAPPQDKLWQLRLSNALQQVISGLLGVQNRVEGQNGDICDLKQPCFPTYTVYSI